MTMLTAMPRSFLKAEHRDKRGHRYCTQPEVGRVPCSNLNEGKSKPIDSSVGHIDDVPPKMGTVPIPNDHVRVYSYTRGDIASIKREGLRLDKARGHTYGEPDLVWGSTQPPERHHNIVEFHVPAADLSSMVEKPGKEEDLREWEKGNHRVGLLRDVKPNEIIAIHEPWHERYHYIEERPDVMGEVLAGKHDDLLDDPEYGPAIAKIKADHDVSRHSTAKNVNRRIAKSQDMRGKPCPPGYNNKRDGCIEGESHAHGQAKPEEKPQSQQSGTPQPKIGWEEGRKLVDMLRDDGRVFKLPGGEMIRAGDIRARDNLTGAPTFVAILRQNAHDPDSPLIGKEAEVSPSWVRTWANSAASKSQGKPTPQGIADRNKPYQPGSEAYQKPEDKPVLEGVGKLPVSNLKPSKPERGPSTGVLPKEKPERKPKQPRTFANEEDRYQHLVKNVSRFAKVYGLQPVTINLIPAFKRDKETGEYLKDPKTKKKIPKTKPEKDKNGNPTGKRIQTNERELLGADGKRLPWAWQQLSGLIVEGGTNIHMNPDASPAVRYIGPRSKFDPKLVIKSKTKPALLKSNRAKNLSRTDSAIDRGDDAKLLDRFKKDSKSGDRFIRDNANLAWLITEHATRPGSENDNKGAARWFGRPLDAKQCKVEHLKDPKGNLKYVDKDKKVPMLKVSISLPGAQMPFEVKGEAARIMAAHIKSKKPLGDTAYWLKSYGASTLEGRHVVVDKKGNVKLQFMGKDTQWHSHGVDDPDLANMLIGRKSKVGDNGKLFGGTDDAKLRKYIKGTGIGDKNGNHYKPKNLRTFRATKMARALVKAYKKSPKNMVEFRKMQNEVADKVCEKLGNKRGMVLKNYISFHTWYAWKNAADIEEKLSYEKSWRR